MNALLVRVDSRLVHGQVVAGWLPRLRARRIVVADDVVARDPRRVEIFRLAIPREVSFEASSVVAAGEAASRDPARPPIVLFSTVSDAARAHAAGFRFEALNVGNVHAGVGCREITGAVHLADVDLRALGALASAGVAIDFRSVPGDALGDARLVLALATMERRRS